MKGSTFTWFSLVTGSVCSIVQPLAAGQSKWMVGQAVQTNSGSIVGHPAPDAMGVSEYLGIPYAKPPVGELRFARPRRYDGKGNMMMASEFGAACPLVQEPKSVGAVIGASLSHSVNFTAAGAAIQEQNSEYGEMFSEDCLTVNVWTKPQMGEAKKAVLVWIHGGGFTIGSSRIPLYNGKYIADREDVVVVTMNYRLNIFGYPGSSAGRHNVGLMDQRMAIEWVRDNIANFGGDPNRITLFGQSAGGGAVDFYSYAFTSDPIVNGFIEQSGTTEVVPPLKKSESAEMWNKVTSTLGCGSASTNASVVMKCMRKANASAILAAVGSMEFTPTIDSKLVFDDYPMRSKAGKFIKKPLLLGNNDNESSVFRVGSLIDGRILSDSHWDEVNLMSFVCPCAARANISVYNQVPTWRYRWFGVYPNTNLTTDPDSGAYHAAEIPILFNTPPTGKGIPANTAEEMAVMKYSSGAWAAFAKDPMNGLNKYQGGWPMYDSMNNTLVRLGYMGTMGMNLAMPQMYDKACGMMFSAKGEIGMDMGNTAGMTQSSDTSMKSLSPLHLVMALSAIMTWVWLM